MKTSIRYLSIAWLLCTGPAIATVPTQQNFVKPGDPVIASSANSPGSEGVANAIDGQPTKYLNRDSGIGKPAGFAVTPSAGPTTIVAISLLSANDAPERDPKMVTVEGSNDASITSFDIGNWEMIARIDIPSWTQKFGGDNRFKTQTFQFNNAAAKCRRINGQILAVLPVL